ncbi:MAG: T9SS type A sorting domain-containing protein [Chitinophagales bacterium]
MKSILLGFLIAFFSSPIYIPKVEAQTFCGSPPIVTPFIKEYFYGDMVTAWAMAPLTDGGVVIAGEIFTNNATKRNAVVIRLGANLSETWVQPFTSDVNLVAYAVAQASDGSILVCGTKKSNHFGPTQNYNVWFTKLALSDGHELVTGGYEYGGDGNEDGYGIIEDVTNQHYIIVGAAGKVATDDLANFSLNGVGEFWAFTIKTSDYTIDYTNGFNAIFPGAYTSSDSDADDFARSIIIDLNGNYVISGFCASCEPQNSDIPPHQTQQLKLVKITPTGTNLNLDPGEYGEDFHDQGGYQVIQTSDGGYLSAGVHHLRTVDCKNSYGTNKHDAYAVKTANDGSNPWTGGCLLVNGINYGGFDKDEAYGVVQTPDGGYLLAGETHSANNDVTCNHDADNITSDIWFLKLNSSGNREWDGSLGGIYNDEAHAILRLSNGSYLVAGHYGNTDVKQKLYVVNFALTCDIPTGEYTDEKTKISAKVHWNVTNSANKYKVQYRVTGTNPWITVSATNNYKKLTGLTCNTQYDWQVRSVCNDLNLGNSAWSSTQTFSTLACRLSGDDDKAFSEVQIFPNPFSTSTTISFTIVENSQVTIDLFDLAGRKLETILDGNLEAGINSVQLSRELLASGIYFLKLKVNEETTITKLLVQ